MKAASTPYVPVRPAGCGPATAPQPAFEVRESGGALQICLPGAG